MRFRRRVFLHADLQEAERGERRLDGPLPVDHVQRDRNDSGQRGQQEQRGERTS